MAFDQDIVYRARIDDSNFQAKLTQMRASIDSTVGGGGMGGGGNFSRQMGYMAPMMAGSNLSGSPMGGLADFGSQIAPVTYTPPAMAMQPHFGMFQLQQTQNQSMMASMLGPSGIALNAMRSNGVFSQKEYLSPQISYNEYLGYSTRGFADRMGTKAAALTGAVAGIGADMAGGAAGTAIAGMLGLGTIGGLALPMALGMAAAAPVAGGVERAMNQIGIQSTLEAGSFRAYQGGDVDPLTGRGFNRAARHDIATGIARMESNDSRFNMSDYRQILEGGMQMDLFSGTRDAEDFKTKFKGLTETLKTVSSTLHTSLKEGLETIRGLRDMGITDPGTQQKVIMNTEVLGRMSGKTGMEMLAVGQAGAEMFRGTGINMQRGFELNQQNTALVQNMLNQGDVSRETVAQMGGVNAAGQQMTASALSSFQTTLGRGTLMAAFNPATGGLDKGVFSSVAGSMDPMGMMGRAAAMASSPGNMAKFIAHQEDLISSLSPGEMQAFSIQQTMKQAKMLQQNFGGDVKDWYRTVGKQYEGKSKEVLDVEMGILSTDPQKYKENLITQKNLMQNQQSLEHARNTYMGTKYFGNAFTRAVTQPLSEIITGAYNDVATGVENISQNVMQNLFGGLIDTRQYSSGTVTAAKDFETVRIQDKINNKDYDQDFVKQKIASDEKSHGKKFTKKEAAAAEKGAIEEAARRSLYKGTGGEVTDLAESGVLSWFGSSNNGTGTPVGEFLKEVEDKGSVGGVQVQSFANMQAVKDAQKATGQHYNVLGKINGRGTIAVSDEDLATMGANRRKMQVTDEEVDKQSVELRKEQYKNKIRAVVQDPTVANIGRQVFGEKFNMHNYMSGGYGKDGQAKMLAFAKAAHATEAELEIREASSTKLIDDLVQHASAQEIHSMSTDRTNVEYMFSHKSNAMGIQGLASDAEVKMMKDDAKAGKLMEAVALVGRGKGGEQQALDVLAGTGASARDVNQILQDLKTARDKTPSLYKKMEGYSTEFLRKASLTEHLNSTESGLDTSKSGGLAGDTSQQNMDNMKKLADSLEAQIKIIQTLQASLQASVKGH